MSKRGNLAAPARSYISIRTSTSGRRVVSLHQGEILKLFYILLSFSIRVFILVPGIAYAIPGTLGGYALALRAPLYSSPTVDPLSWAHTPTCSTSHFPLITACTYSNGTRIRSAAAAVVPCLARTIFLRVTVQRVRGERVGSSVFCTLENR